MFLLGFVILKLSGSTQLKGKIAKKIIYDQARVDGPARVTMSNLDFKMLGSQAIVLKYYSICFKPPPTS